VEEIVYVGTETRYLVRLTSATVVSVRQQNVDADTAVRFSEGAPVYLHWLPEATRVLAD